MSKTSSVSSLKFNLIYSYHWDQNTADISGALFILSLSILNFQYGEGARDVNNNLVSHIQTIYNYSGVSTMSEIRRRFRVHDEQDTDHKERDKVTMILSHERGA